MINKTILVGRVGNTPEIKTTQDGKEIAILSLATSFSWKDKVTGEKKEKTEWHNVAIFNSGIINFVKSYVKKGSLIYVEGALGSRKIKDKLGTEKKVVDIVLRGFDAKLQLLDKKQEASTPPPFQEPEDNFEDFPL